MGRDTEIYSCQKSMLRLTIWRDLNKINKNTLSLRTEWFVPHIKHPSTWVLNWKDKPLKPVTLTINRAHVYENHRTIGKKDSTLKSSYARLVT